MLKKKLFAPEPWKLGLPTTPESRSRPAGLIPRTESQHDDDALDGGLGLRDERQEPLAVACHIERGERRARSQLSSIEVRADRFGELGSIDERHEPQADLPGRCVRKGASEPC